MVTTCYDTFFQLVRLGIGQTKPVVGSGIVTNNVDWADLKTLADAQGLSAVVLDGIDSLNANDLNGISQLPLELKLEWIGEVVQGELTYKLHQEVATDMANLFHRNGIRTYVLKGRVVAECYPKPNHRVSSDMDCYLLSDGHNENKGALRSHKEAWLLGNELIKAKHFDVSDGFYKNSVFKLPGLTVENHQFLTPFRGNERLASLEKVLQSMFREDRGEDIIEGTWLNRPPVMVSALFLIEHAYSHFLHEGLTWRMVLDWVMFSNKHKTEIDWTSFEAYVDEFGLRKFYDVFNAIGQGAFGNGPLRIGELEDSTSKTAKLKRLMLADIWAPLDLHETLHGIRGKLALAGNTWRARWKYRYFTDINWIKALWIQAYGVLFDKQPTLW